MPEVLGDAVVRIGTDDTALKRGLKAAAAKVKAWSHSMISAGIGLAAFGGTVVAAIKMSSSAVGDFEDQMSNVSTMLSDADMKFMPIFRKGVKEASLEFGESTDTISKGLYDILSASVAPENAMQVLMTSLKAATGGLTDTGTAADALTTILNAYQIPATKAADVSDWLFSVVKRGKTTFPELAASIGNVATNAALSGVSLEEVGAAIATMTRSGIDSATATTSLNATIMGFLKPTNDAAKAAKKYGIELNTNTLKSIGLMGVFKKLKELSTEEITEIFPNIRSIRGVLPLINDLAGAEYDMSIMTNRAGAAQTAYAKVTASFGFQLKKIKQSFTAIKLELGEALMPLFKEYAAKIKDTIPKIIDWIKTNKYLIIDLVKLSLGLGAAGMMLLAFAGAFKAIAIITNPFAMLATTILLVADAFGVIDTGLWDTVKNFKIGGLSMVTIFRTVGLAVYKIWEAIKTYGKLAWDAMKSTAKYQADNIIFIFKAMGASVAVAFYWILDKVVKAINVVIKGLNKLPHVHIGLLDTFEGEIEESSKMLNDLTVEHGKDVENYFTGVKDAASDATDAILKEWDYLDEVLKGVVEDATNADLGKQAGKLRNELQKKLKDLNIDFDPDDSIGGLRKKLAGALSDVGKNNLFAGAEKVQLTRPVDVQIDEKELQHAALGMFRVTDVALLHGPAADAQKRTAKATEETAKNTKALVSKIGAGATFT